MGDSTNARDPNCMSSCLIITAAAEEFADEIAAQRDSPLSVIPCTSAAKARAAYAGQTVLFGNPSMIAEVLADMPGVDWVQSTWAGVTPLMNHPRRDYVLTGVKDVFGPQMSEYVFGYLLAHELKIRERDAAQRRREWYTEHSGVLADKRLGVLGTGSIGRHIARTARTFDMQVSGFSRSGKAVPEFDNVFPVDRLHEFLGGVDYVVSTLPQTKETDNLLDAAALACLPKHAYFINVGRSNVINDKALVDALRSGQLAGAALDVFDEEPPPDDDPMWDTPNLSITAHIAAISHPSLIVPIFLENYRRYANDESLDYVIDFDAGY